MEYVPERVDAHVGSSGVQKVRTKGMSRAEPISTGQMTKKSVFSQKLLFVTSRSSHGYTIQTVPAPSPGNHTLQHNKDVCHMNLRQSSLQHSNTRQFITRPMAYLTMSIAPLPTTIKHKMTTVSKITPSACFFFISCKGIKILEV
jgi:hypothetical protein